MWVSQLQSGKKIQEKKKIWKNVRLVGIIVLMYMRHWVVFTASFSWLIDSIVSSILYLTLLSQEIFSLSWVYCTWHYYHKKYSQIPEWCAVGFFSFGGCDTQGAVVVLRSEFLIGLQMLVHVLITLSITWPKRTCVHWGFIFFIYNHSSKYTNSFVPY